MINLDLFIKIARERLVLGDINCWVKEARRLLRVIEEIKKGFPGLGDDHLSLIKSSELKVDDLYIYHPSLDYNKVLVDETIALYTTEEPPILWAPGICPGNLRVEGIGKGRDYSDLELKLIRWGDEFSIDPPNSPDVYVLRVDVRPTENGGPGYYYFYKSPRDFRK